MSKDNDPLEELGGPMTKARVLSQPSSWTSLMEM